MIYTSRSQYTATDRCPRFRWLAYEAPNGTDAGDGLATFGWERKAHVLPLATGTYVHRGLAAIISGANTPYDAAYAAADAYRADMNERGLEAAGDITSVIEEQAVLIAGLIYGWGTVRWPAIQAEWDVVDGWVEREGAANLTDDIVHQFRCDWLGRRKADSQLFVWDFKTCGMVDERWLRGWEIDSQALLNCWAVEQVAGERVAGFIVEGLIKGTRRKDKDEFGQTIGERQQSVLCYGYYHAGEPPLTPATWTHEYKRGRGWQRFAVGGDGHPLPTDWFDALPSDVREGFFVSVPPVYRDDERVMRKLRQVIAREYDLSHRADRCRSEPDLLDHEWPQNEHSCLWPTRCSFFDACHTRGVIDDMAGSGLFIPRVPNHPAMEAEDA